MWAAPLIEAFRSSAREIFRLRWLAPVLLTCGVAGCALTRSITPAPASSASLSTGASALLAGLADRDRSLHSMRSGAVMDYSGTNGRFRTHEEIALARPVSMRVEAVAPFGATMVLAADNAGRLTIFDPGKNVLMSGAANAATLARYVQIPLTPASAVNLLMGLAPDPAQLSKAPDSVSDTDGMTVAAWRLADGGTREIGFSGGQLAAIRERDAAGAERYAIKYSDWREIDGISFPEKLEADFPANRVTLRYQTPALNAAIAPTAFVLTPVPGTRQISIDTGAAPGSSG
jgi:Domain of unknown function (DUF4292)